MSSASNGQYLALVFFDPAVVAAIWQPVGQRVSIIARSGLSSSPEASLSHGVDLALEELGEESLALKQVLLVVPRHWTEDGVLTPEKRKFLKQLTHDLLLEPLGFVILEDTLLSWQEEQIGNVFAGAFLFEEATQWRIQPVAKGITQAPAQVEKSEDAHSDWQELIAQLKQSISNGKRLLYVDLRIGATDYDQNVVKLRQQLQVPVEKLRPEQATEISVMWGGHEVLSAGTPEATPVTDSQAEEKSSAGTHEFHTPEFAKQLVHKSSPEPEEESNVVPVELDEDEPAAKKTSKLKLPALNLKLPKISIGKLNGKLLQKSPKLVIGLGVLALVLMSLLGGFIWTAFSYTAKVDITLQSQTLENTSTIPLEVADSTASGQLSEDALPATKITETLTIDKEVPTTGTKIVGDPAKGKVRIFNKTDEARTFAAGTKLTANQKVYVLDSEVTVASASAKVSSIEFGAAEADVTADFIGPEGNIGKDQKLSVGGFASSSYDAITVTEFSGGSSREIQAVAEKDINQAVKDLQEAAKAQFTDRFSQQQSDTLKVLFAGEVSTLQRETSAKTGEEAKFVRVQIEVEGTAYQIEQAATGEFLQKLFASEVPNGYVLRENSATLTAENLRIQAGVPEVELKVQVQAVPQLVPSELQAKIGGQYAGRAVTLLQETPGIQNASVQIQPSWASALLTQIPKNEKRVMFNMRLQ